MYPCRCLCPGTSQVNEMLRKFIEAVVLAMDHPFSGKIERTQEKP